MVLLEAREEHDQPVVEARDGVGGPITERPQVDPHPDARAVGPEVGALEDEGFEEPDAIRHGLPLESVVPGSIVPTGIPSPRLKLVAS